MDERTRDSHRALNGIVRPVDDAFWKTYFPPNGWNCRCEAIQTDDKVTPVPGKLPVLDEMFRRNPGEELKVFDIDKIPYAASLNKTQKSEVKTKANFINNWNSKLSKADKQEIYKLPIEQQYYTLKKFRKGGKVKVHKTYIANTDDHDDLLEYAYYHAIKYKTDVNILPIINSNEKAARDLIMPGHKGNTNADFFNRRQIMGTRKAYQGK